MAHRPLLRQRIDVYPVLITITTAALQLGLAAYVREPLWLALASIPLYPLFLMSVPIAHNHHHTPSFHSPVLNHVYETLLFFQCASPSGGWALNHNVGHHLNFRNQDHDSEDHDEYYWVERDGRITSRLRYLVRTPLRSYGLMWRNGKRFPALRRRWLWSTALYVVIFAAFAWWRPWAALLLCCVPVTLMILSIGWFSYVHHVGLRSDDDYAASYTRLGRLSNLFTFNTGYHTAHHIRPGLHWSKLPEFHESIRHRIPAHCYHDGDVPAAVREIIRAARPVTALTAQAEG